jgi:DNA-binding PadR family transcriptional regulator
MPQRDVRDHIPMSEAMFHVLVSLADEGEHGYSIMKEVAERTNGVQLSTGTLHGIVRKNLARFGLEWHTLRDAERQDSIGR